MTRMRWMAFAVLIAVTAFGFGRTDGGDDGTTVRTERVRESAASDGAAPAPAKRTAGYESGGETVEAVLARTADDGTLVRVLLRSWDAGVAEDGAGWSPPPQCSSTAGLEIGLATDDFVTTGYAEVFGGPAPTSPELWGSGTIGYAGIGDVSYAAVRVEDDGVPVWLAHDGEVVDAVESSDGWAIVAGQVPASGTEVVYGEVRRSIGEVDWRGDAAECQPPPPALPDDVSPASEADRDGIQAALDGAFARAGEPRDPRPFLSDAGRLTDDWLAEMRAAVESYVSAGVTVEVHDAGVRDDGTGAVVYRLIGPPVGWQVADVVLVDGTWKLATSSWCELVGMVFSCP